MYYTSTIFLKKDFESLCDVSFKWQSNEATPPTKKCEEKQSIIYRVYQYGSLRKNPSLSKGNLL